MKIRNNNQQQARANQEVTIAKETILEKYVWNAVEQLSSFVGDSGFFTKMSTVFGENINFKNLSSATLPSLEVLASKNLNGANGAYSVDTNTIYISQEFINNNLENPQVISDLLLEEIGHSIDNILNQADTPGDEGEYFAAVVNDRALSPAEIARITTEDDTGTITLNGKTISVEQQAFTGTDDNDSIVGTSGDDTIDPGLGQDTVDGAAGNDLLMVDYSSNTNTDSNAGIYSYNVAGSSGYIEAYDETGNIDQVSYSNIEQINIIGTICQRQYCYRQW